MANKKREKNTEKLTQEDAQLAIRGNFLNAVEAEMPTSWRLKRWKDLAEAKSVKVFHNEKMGILYSKQLGDLNTQIRAMENISKMAGDYPAGGMSFEGSNGERVTFECHFGGDPKNKRGKRKLATT